MGVFLAVWALCAAATAALPGPTVGLLDGLAGGELRAEFRGAGDSGLTGVVARTGDDPLQVIIPQGLQFYAQIRGGGGGGGGGLGGGGGGGVGGAAGRGGAGGAAGGGGAGGRQGMLSLAPTEVDLGQPRYAQVWIPAACTDFGLQEPGPEDVMAPAPCPREDLQRIARALIFAEAPQPVIQVAVWAVSDNVLAPPLRTYLRGQELASRGALTSRGIMVAAADLLATAGLDPRRYRTFR